MGGRWRTVCTGSQDLARAVCSRTGIESLVLEGDDHLIAIYLNQISQLYTGSTVAVTNSFPPGAFPEHSLECEQQSDGELRCALVEQQCDSFVELEVVCKNYEDLRNEYLRNCIMPTLSTNMQVITELPTTSKVINYLLAYTIKHLNSMHTEMYSTPCETTNNNGSSTSLLAVIAVLVILQAATMIALISTCIVFNRKHKQK